MPQSEWLVEALYGWLLVVIWVVVNFSPLDRVETLSANMIGTLRAGKWRRGRLAGLVLPTTSPSGFESTELCAHLHASARPAKQVMTCSHQLLFAPMHLRCSVSLQGIMVRGRPAPCCAQFFFNSSQDCDRTNLDFYL